jgi:hypothetical protein
LRAQAPEARKRTPRIGGAIFSENPWWARINPADIKKVASRDILNLVSSKSIISHVMSGSYPAMVSNLKFQITNPSPC